MIDTQTPGSPGWWLARLQKRLLFERPRYDKLERYWTGEALVPLGSDANFREVGRRLQHICRTNFAELICQAPRERMNPVGFRTGASGTAQDDKDAWKLWQANSLDADVGLLFDTVLSLSTGYMIVGPPDPETGFPVVTPEDPREVITENDPIRRRRSKAGLKLFHDPEEGADVAYVYVPGKVWKAMRPAKEPAAVSSTALELDNGSAWEWVGDPVTRPAPIVGVTRFVNQDTLRQRPDRRGRGWGEYERHIPHLDRINYTILQRAEIATMQAFRQRAAKGLPLKDEQGNDIDWAHVFKLGPGEIWSLPEGAEMWESGQVDLTPVRQAIRDDVQDLAAVTRTPLYYLIPDSASGSAEGASLAKEGLVFRSWDRIRQATESIEQVMADAFLLAGDEKRASRVDMEVLWASPANSSMAERYDAAVKAMAAGVPWRTIMAEVLEFSPQAIDRMESERVFDIAKATSFTPDQPVVADTAHQPVVPSAV